jgi:hypothetical protein
VIFADQAKMDRRAIEQPTALQILKTVARFLQSGDGDVKRLQGIEPPLFRCGVKIIACCFATSAMPSRSPESAIAKTPIGKPLKHRKACLGKAQPSPQQDLRAAL